MKIHKGYKFRLEPTKEQKVKINKTLGCCRFVYNSILDRRIKAYKRRGESMSYIDTQNLLPQMKTYLPWLAEVDSQALKYSCRQLDNAYKGFFKDGKGFPQFKRKRGGKAMVISRNNAKPSQMSSTNRKQKHLAFLSALLATLIVFLTPLSVYAEIQATPETAVASDPVPVENGENTGEDDIAEGKTEIGTVNNSNSDVGETEGVRVSTEESVGTGTSDPESGSDPVLTVAASTPMMMSADPETQSRGNCYLQNGGFEDYAFSGNYVQVADDSVPYWNTTAYGKLIEMFRENTNVYIKNTKLTPSEGLYAAELNADEASSLYQIVTTIPNTIYEWGLDHRGRLGNDTMALVIGPAQENAPTKTAKNGQDQYMQMVEWANNQGLINLDDFAPGTIQELSIYSKKFGENGTFLNNEDGYAFSSRPDTTYTEEWKIWVMMSSPDAWISYGSNTKSAIAEELQDSFYIVPDGQTSTIFAFTAIKGYDASSDATKKNTYGNFLDNINFKLYQPLSSSSTMHGSANLVVGDKSVSVAYENSYAKYVLDGTALNIRAIVAKDDLMDDHGNGVVFAGVIYTVADETGTAKQTFLSAQDGTWTVEYDEEGNQVYTREMSEVLNATDLHFVFIRSPVVTYDPNGGLPYDAFLTGEEEPQSCVSFAPTLDVEGHATYVFPYNSHDAIGQDTETWRFLGWQLLDDNGVVCEEDGITPVLVQGVHSVACSYNLNISTTDKRQYFQLQNGADQFIDGGQIEYAQNWNTWDGSAPLYGDYAFGLTLIAQWRWRQRFVPLSKVDGSYVNNTTGGSVSVVNGEEQSTGILCTDYYAEAGERVTAVATPAEGWAFEGWYSTADATQPVTMNPTLIFTEEKEKANTYYAKFSNTVTQTYIRRVMDGEGNLVEQADDDATLVPVLSHTTHVDAKGVRASSNASLATGYAFLGWFDSEGNRVDTSYLANNGQSISYLTTGDATYYADYVADASVRVSKEVGGTLGDKKKTTFNFTITVTNPDGSMGVYQAGSNVAADGKATFGLKHGQSLTISGLVPGAKVVIQETSVPSGYTVKYQIGENAMASGKTATISTLTDGDTVRFVNTKEGTPDVGVGENSSPLSMILFIVGAMLALPMTYWRKHFGEEHFTD